MMLADRFELQKAAVAEILARFVRDSESRSRLARKLEAELLEQLGFDHRDIEGHELASIWNSTPDLNARTTSAKADNLKGSGIASATYAFRMLVLAHVRTVLPAAQGDEFERFLHSLGHGLPEVDAYKADFVQP